VLQAEQLLPARVRFVGAHPIAGREKTGVAAGSPDLFRGARCILTPTERTDPSALRVIEGLWQEAGAIVSRLDPFLHDRVLGAVSHLPHVVAFALMNTLTSLCDRSGAEPDLFPYAGGGLRDTTRIAASSPELWRDIFLWNRNNVLEMIDVYEQQLRQLKRLIEAGDSSAIQKELERAKQAREQCEAPMGFPGMAAQPTVD
jgi:prephenate dehydrogenase